MTDPDPHTTSLAQKLHAKRFAVLSVLCPIPLAVTCVALAEIEPGSHWALPVAAVALPPFASALLGLVSHLRQERALKWVGLGLLLSLAPLSWAVYLLTHIQVGF
ncbi:hypothetical protein LRH25_26180 [Ideonella azotifigens]|uniref:Uncharacterized protein n=1 Tax=Ideonella azotifigens TaxID=513160 RepID=A0ABN1K2I8_9BURK|nr:hypothetical protein [Ideonella azotifigens]MCD2343816.1 hypothetical protein [Ideonella azotifigens]